MNINRELVDLYATAKTAGKLDLAFRILACLAKMKPDALSLDILSAKDMTSIITECESLVHDVTQENEIEMNGAEPPSSSSFSISPTHAHIQVKAQLDPPP